MVVSEPLHHRELDLVVGPRETRFRPGGPIARSDARFMMLGGEPMDGLRIHVVELRVVVLGSIEQAKANWKAARFNTVPGDNEFIPPS